MPTIFNEIFKTSWFHHFSASHLNCLLVQHRSIWWIMSNGAAILSQESSHWLHIVWHILWMCLASSGNSYWVDAGRVQKTAPGIYEINVQNWNTRQHERRLKNQTRPNCLRWLFRSLCNYGFCIPTVILTLQTTALKRFGVPLFSGSVWIVSQGYI